MAGNRSIDLRKGIRNCVAIHFPGRYIEDDALELLSKIINSIHSKILTKLNEEQRSRKDDCFHIGAQNAIAKTCGALRSLAVAEAQRQFTLYEMGCMKYDNESDMEEPPHGRSPKPPPRKLSPSPIRKKSDARTPGSPSGQIPPSSQPTIHVGRQKEKHFIAGISKLCPSNVELDDKAKEFVGNHLYQLATKAAIGAADSAKRNEVTPKHLKQALSGIMGPDTFATASSEGARCLALYRNGLIQFRPAPATRKAKKPSGEVALAGKQKKITLTRSESGKGIFGEDFASGIRGFMEKFAHSCTIDKKGIQYLQDILQNVANTIASEAARRCESRNIPELGCNEIRDTMADLFTDNQVRRHALCQGSEYVMHYQNGLVPYYAGAISAKTKAKIPKKTPSRKTPLKKAPSKKTPLKKTPSKKTPLKKTPSKKTPSKKTPSKKTPSKKTKTERKKVISGKKAITSGKPTKRKRSPAKEKISTKKRKLSRRVASKTKPTKKEERAVKKKAVDTSVKKPSKKKKLQPKKKAVKMKKRVTPRVIKKKPPAPKKAAKKVKAAPKAEEKAAKKIIVSPKPSSRKKVQLHKSQKKPTAPSGRRKKERFGLLKKIKPFLRPSRKKGKKKPQKITQKKKTKPAEKKRKRKPPAEKRKKEEPKKIKAKKPVKSISKKKVTAVKKKKPSPPITTKPKKKALPGKKKEAVKRKATPPPRVLKRKAATPAQTKAPTKPRRPQPKLKRSALKVKGKGAIQKTKKPTKRSLTKKQKPPAKKKKTALKVKRSIVKSEVRKKRKSPTRKRKPSPEAERIVKKQKASPKKKPEIPAVEGKIEKKRSSLKKPSSEAAKIPKRTGKLDFNAGLREICTALFPLMQVELTSDAVKSIGGILEGVCHILVTHSVQNARELNKGVLADSNVRNATLSVLPDELSQHAVSRGENVVSASFEFPEE